MKPISHHNYVAAMDSTVSQLNLNCWHNWLYVKSLSQAQLSIISEVCTLVKLLLVSPATNAVSKRSVSGLRRIKSTCDPVVYPGGAQGARAPPLALTKYSILYSWNKDDTASAPPRLLSIIDFYLKQLIKETSYKLTSTKMVDKNE